MEDSLQNSQSPIPPRFGKRVKTFGSILSIFLLTAAVGVGVYLTQRNQNIRSRAGGATLTLSTNNSSPNAGDSFTVAVAIDSAGLSVTGSSVEISYDPNLLTATAVNIGDFLPVTLTPASITSGKASIVAGCSPGSPKSGTGILATVVFTAKGSGSSNITFSSNTAVAAIGQASNVAGTLNPVHLTPPQSLAITGWWSFDEGSGYAVDSSGNGLTGVPTGTSIIPGRYGNSRNFNGTTDSVTVGASNKLDFTRAFTIDAWIYRSAAQKSPDSAIAAKLGTYPYNGYMLWYRADNTVDLYINGAARANSTAVIPANAWTHVAGVWDGTTPMIYINGELSVQGPSYTGSPASSGQTFWIGRYSDSPRVFTGVIDAVHAYASALSKAQIQQDMNNLIQP